MTGTMKQSRLRSTMKVISMPLLGTAVLLSGWVMGPLLVVRAQYTTHTQAPAKKKQILRSVALLEWVGDEAKPTSSRLVPVVVFDGHRYQDADIYLTKPAPLAVQSETEYELQKSGVATGFFDVLTAAKVADTWYGYGKWRPIVVAPPPKLQAAKIMPQVVGEVDSSRPHFANKPPSSGGASGGDAGKPSDPAKSSDSGSGTEKGTNRGTTGTGDMSGSTAGPDPERPTLRKRPKDVASASNAADESVTATSIPDPDRPTLHHGKPDQVMAAERLSGTPANLRQMVAVSDATTKDTHPFVYQWSSADDAAKMQAAMEKIAKEAIVAKNAPPAAPARKATGATKAPATSAAKTTGAAHSTAAKKAAAPAVPLPDLVDEQFHAFELAYGGESTLVFTARTIGEGAAMKYVTVIAQPDLYGVPKVIFKQVTDAAHLADLPFMRLIDAVDVDADNRAELLFELRSTDYRQFAVWKVLPGKTESVFVSGALP